MPVGFINAAVDQLSRTTAVPEPALRFILALLMGIPAALIFRRQLLRPNVTREMRNAYVLATGVAIAAFFCRYSRDLWPSLGATALTWLVLRAGQAAGARRAATAVVWVGNLSYLMLCYVNYASDGYDMNWLTPQSVLTLRLLGLASDWCDGGLPEGERPDRALESVPSFTETLGYSYFFGAWLAGPQLPYSLYRDLLTLDLFGTDRAAIPSARWYAWRCVLVGATYLVVQQIGEAFITLESLAAPAFARQPLWTRLLQLWIAGKLFFSRYLGVWVLNETTCVLSGISYSGRDQKSQRPDWSGLANVHPRLYETPTRLNDIILSFNVNTNDWAKRYVYKRLRFLGNKHLSSLGALGFLCLWHGLHLGYPLCFALEFLDMVAENRLYAALTPRLGPVLGRAPAPLRWLARLAGYIVTTSLLHYALVPFALLHWAPIHAVWSSVWYFGHAVLLAALVAGLLVVGTRSRATVDKND